MTLRAEAPAKINRELRVGPMRADGFHQILSRFASIDLTDTIEVEPAEDLRLEVEGAALSADDSNLAIQAARLLADRLSMRPRAHIRLSKKVPVGGGLGGGSADAAVTLLLLAQLWKASLSPQELIGLAALLGSDVPYFLLGGEADVSGRGELVTPREDGPSEELLLLVPPFSLSTAEVYTSYDRAYGPAGRRLPPKLEVETSGKFFGPNDLALAVLEIQSEMITYLTTAARLAAESAMTGSGSAIAMRGVSPESGRALAQALPQGRLIRCRTMGRDEYQRRIHPSGGTSWT